MYDSKLAKTKGIGSEGDYEDKDVGRKLGYDDDHAQLTVVTTMLKNAATMMIMIKVQSLFCIK